MSKTYDTIEYLCCGEYKVINNLYDCNLIGSYDLIWSILKKVQKYGDMMKNHEYKEKTAIDNNTWYTKYVNISCSGCSMSAPTGHSYESDVEYSDCLNNFNFLNSYTSGYSTKFNDIFSSIPKSVKRGSTKGELSDKNAYCLYGTKSELENWKHFVFNNKLPLFINIVMNIDQHNNSLPYMPWLVDKIYTDDEINKMFDFTEDEINLIDKTLKKFERHSLWFKRYVCGPSSLSDEDVQKYGDMMENHYISRNDIKYNRWQNHVNDNTYFVKVPDIFGGTGGALCGIIATGGNIDQEVCYVNTSNGDYITPYTSATYHYYQNSISKNIHHAYDRGKHLTDNPTMCVYGTKSELENWKHFVFNNKLPLFINIVMTINQNNNSLPYMPWLVDKIYTDDEINKLFNFTEDEINLIDKTLKKFERHSLWFKRYVCGPSSVTDE
jgi:hypothetical protein